MHVVFEKTLFPSKLSVLLQIAEKILKNNGCNVLWVLRKIPTPYVFDMKVKDDAQVRCHIDTFYIGSFLVTFSPSTLTIVMVVIVTSYTNHKTQWTSKQSSVFTYIRSSDKKTKEENGFRHLWFLQVCTWLRSDAVSGKITFSLIYVVKFGEKLFALPTTESFG